jgi:RNA polymerase sigma-70 factor (ECF subfamily)
VADTREFFNLAAAVIRRELLDLARHFYGPRGVGTNHASNHAPGDGSPTPDPPARTDPAALDRWTALHEAGRRDADRGPRRGPPSRLTPRPETAR